jgi:Flp pilus assembly CpaF family ATPase
MTATAEVTEHDQRPDPAVVAEVARAVSERLVSQRVGRGVRIRGGGHEQRSLVARLVADELAEMELRRVATGIEPLGDVARERLGAAVVDLVVGLGRLQPLLDDPLISDIHVRGADSVWVKYRDGSRVSKAPIAADDDELVDLIRSAAARLGPDERRFDAAHPELNLELPDGSRLFAVMAVSSRPSVIIRRHRFEMSALSELVGVGLADAALAAFLAAAVRARRNLIIAGGTGSGKTTLLRALINEVGPAERIVTIEDSYELGIGRFAERHPDHDALQARPANTEGRGAIDMADLARMALRMDPDRVVLGEVRGQEAFAMLLAMSQGNNGSMCTLHAESSRAVFAKLAAYVSMAGTGLGIETVNLLIAHAVHLVVHIDIVDGVRRITSVREVVDADGARIISNEIFRPGPDRRAVPGFPPSDALSVALERAGYDPARREPGARWS